MPIHVTIDLVSHDPHNDEFVLYLVEDGPWPISEDGWADKLKTIQNKILDVFDASVDGGLEKVYPDSRGKAVRIQIDSPSGEPASLRSLVEKLNDFINSDKSYREAVMRSEFVRGVRIVTGHQLGRFRNSGTI
jgi:hypothetical protein